MAINHGELVGISARELERCRFPIKHREFCDQLVYGGAEKPLECSVLGRDAGVNAPEIAAVVDVVQQACRHNRRGQPEGSEDAGGSDNVSDENLSGGLEAAGEKNHCQLVRITHELAIRT